jgi:hypothetical protein
MFYFRYLLCVLMIAWWHNASQADVLIYDSGSTVSGSGTAVGWYGANQFSKAQSFTNNQGACTINMISVWMTAGSALSGSFNLQLFTSTGTAGSNSTPALLVTGNSLTVSTSSLNLSSTAQQVNFTNLNWSLAGNGNYFFVFDASNMSGSSSSSNYFDLLYSDPYVPGQNMAYSTNSDSNWIITEEGVTRPTLAGQVSVSVPEPSTLLLGSAAIGILTAYFCFKHIFHRLTVA